MRIPPRATLCVVLVFLLLPALIVLAQEPAATESLSKPLKEFTIGNIFPKVVGDAFRATGKEWQTAADDFLQRTGERRTSLGQAIPTKKAEIDLLKEHLKAAKKDKDFTKTGTLEGQIKTESIVVAVLKQLEKVNESQAAAAAAWSEVGSAMQRFVDADEKLDQHRGIGIARRRDGADGQRLPADGYTALLQQAESMDDLGKAFAKVGSQLSSLAGRRKSLLNSLAKGGHIEKP